MNVHSIKAVCAVALAYYDRAWQYEKHTCDGDILYNLAKHGPQAFVKESNLLWSFIFVVTLVASLSTVMVDMCIIAVFPMNETHGVQSPR